MLVAAEVTFASTGPSERPRRGLPHARTLHPCPVGRDHLSAVGRRPLVAAAVTDRDVAVPAVFKYGQVLAEVAQHVDNVVAVRVIVERRLRRLG